jgi:hypothetical protein
LVTLTDLLLWNAMPTRSDPVGNTQNGQILGHEQSVKDAHITGVSGLLHQLRHAIHLAGALKVGADEIVTYDAELADTARSADLTVLAPGTSSG